MDDSTKHVFNRKNRKLNFGCLILLFVFLVVISAFLYYYSNHRVWSSNFLIEKSEYISISENVITEEIETSILNKSISFSESNKNIDYINFSVEEAGVIMFDTFKKSLPSNFTVNEIVIRAQNDYWMVYMDLNYKKIPLPWIYMKIEDDNKESMSLNIFETGVGELKINNDFLDINKKLNSGLEKGITFVIENELTSKHLSNIELEEDGIYIKGYK